MSAQIVEFVTAFEKVGWILIHFAWEGVAIASVTAFALGLLRPASAQLRYLVALGGLALMGVAPLATYIVLGEHGTKPARSQASTAPMRERGDAEVREVSYEAAVQPEFVKTTVQPMTGSEGAKLSLKSLAPWVVVVWLAGVALLSAVQLMSFRAVQRMRWKGVEAMDPSLMRTMKVIAEKMGVNRTVGLVASTAAEVPGMIGFFKPLILFPVGALAGLSPAQVEHILAHELAHIRRHDYVVNLMQVTLETLLFYHPAVWWLNRRIRTLREFCCDDMAVAAMGDAKGYALALSQIEELRWQTMEIDFAMNASGGSLVERIGRILGKKERKNRGVCWAAGLTAATMLTLIIACTKNAEAKAEAQSPTMVEATGQTQAKEIDQPSSASPTLALPGMTEIAGWAGVNAMGQKGVTGGAGSEVVTVTNADEFEEYAARPEPLVIQIKGRILGSQESTVSSNKTIVGVSKDAALVGGIVLRSRQNVLIRNVAFAGGLESAIKMLAGTHHVWIDHCSFSGYPATAINAVGNCDYITISWCHFSWQQDAVVIGNRKDITSDTQILRTTLHHNWFEGTTQSNPKVNFSSMAHVYNNYFQDNDAAVSSSRASNLWLEGNYFQEIAKPVSWPPVEGKYATGYLAERNNQFEHCKRQAESGGAAPKDFGAYAYRADAAAQAPSLVEAGAGPAK